MIAQIRGDWLGWRRKARPNSVAQHSAPASAAAAAARLAVLNSPRRRTGCVTATVPTATHTVIP